MIHINKKNLYNYTTLKTNTRKTRQEMTFLHNYITNDHVMCRMQWALLQSSSYNT